MDNSLWVALIGTVFGGAGLKGVEFLLGRKKVSVDEATSIRKELREEIKSLKDEIKRLDEDLDLWRNKYYELLEKFYKLQREIIASGGLDTPPSK